MIQFKILDRRFGLADFGLLPFFFNSEDEPAAKQIDFHYQHGGGWRPFEGFAFDPKTREISYPGDPSFKPIAEVTVGQERVLIYPYSWVLVLQPDGKFEIARID